ncbi:MAG: hypothetical protein AB7V27_03575 [Candidatus Binatia bacterium]
MIGYDNAAQIAHHGMADDLTVKAAASQSGLVYRGGLRSPRRSRQNGCALRRHSPVTRRGLRWLPPRSVPMSFSSAPAS